MWESDRGRFSRVLGIVARSLLEIRLILSQSSPECVQVEGASYVRVELLLFETVEDFDVQSFC